MLTPADTQLISQITMVLQSQGWGVEKTVVDKDEILLTISRARAPDITRRPDKEKRADF